MRIRFLASAFAVIFLLGTAGVSGETDISPEFKNMMYNFGAAYGLTPGKIDEIIQDQIKAVNATENPRPTPPSRGQERLRVMQASPETLQNAVEIRGLLNRMRDAELFEALPEDTNKFIDDVADEMAIAEVLDSMMKKLPAYAAKNGIAIEDMTQQDINNFVKNNITMGEVDRMLSGQIEFTEQEFRQGLERGTEESNIDDLLDALRRK